MMYVRKYIWDFRIVRTYFDEQTSSTRIKPFLMLTFSCQKIVIFGIGSHHNEFERDETFLTVQIISFLEICIHEKKNETAQK